jgi:general secretion pathway protein G
MREGSKSRSRNRSAWRRNEEAFTFIEMVIVIVMLGILLGIAVPIYQAQIRASKESVLKHNLAVIRERLDQFKADRNKYPASLTELVDNGYLREIPEDPMTSSNEWEEIHGDYDPNEPDAEPGIEDVRSRSTDIGVDGRPYSEW